jgi:antagonist of KipI
VSNTSSPIFEVIKPGLLTTIQDLGRAGYQRYGVTPGGAMDPYALRLANRLVGNSESAAGIEITIQGPELKVVADCLIAITGGDLSPSVGSRPVPLWQSVPLKKDQVLRFGSRNRGARSYLGVAGGLSADHALCSQSTDLQARFGGMNGRRLQKSDVLLSNPLPNDRQAISICKVFPEVLWEYSNPFVLRVILGPQSQCLLTGSLERFLEGEYRVSPDSNRMGYRLEGPQIEVSPREMISDAIPLGAIQVLPQGQLVLLMADHQTVGGYPKMAVLISADVPKAAQLLMGDRVRFEMIGLEEAQQLIRAQEEKIHRGVIEG